MMDKGHSPLITSDAVILGLLFIILAFVFYTSSSNAPFWKRLYKYVPSLLLCYFLPSLLNTFNIVDAENSQLYTVASRFLLPASLTLLTISIDMKGILTLGPKAVIMFLAGTFGIVIGGPITIMLFSLISPDIVGGIGPEAVWRGLATIAGSWIGGSANQAAMLETFGASAGLFSTMIAVDVIVANIWMAVLLFLSDRSARIDRKFNADASAIEEVRQRIENYHASVVRIPVLKDLMVILGIGFGVTGLSHFLATKIAPYILLKAPHLAHFSLTSEFFWIIVLATTFGLILSFTKAKKLEGVGASRVGSALLYFLVATIGMLMDVTAIAERPLLFLVGIVWMLVHIGILIGTAKLIKAPFFFVAVGSQANIGGAASAPIVAAAFHPSLAPVGVLLAVLGYALGTYGAWICGILMQAVAP